MLGLLQNAATVQRWTIQRPLIYIYCRDKAECLGNGVVDSGIQWVESKDVSKHLTTDRQPHRKKLSSPRCHQKLCPRTMISSIHSSTICNLFLKSRSTVLEMEPQYMGSFAWITKLCFNTRNLKAVLSGGKNTSLKDVHKCS